MTARVCAAPPSSRQKHGGQVAPLRALLGEEPRPRAARAPGAAAGTCGASAGVFALLGADLCLTLERVLALLADLDSFLFL